jgi:8-oxo-dGTP pyrophosphatase MutT (NUDIX family)/transcriptional regulator with XRE-family HTH domain
MNALGFPEWRRQTVARVEQGNRRPTAEEIFALSYALETSVTRLMSPNEEDHWVTFPNGHIVHAQHGMARMRGTADGAIRWEGNTPVFMAEQAHFGPADDGGPEDYFAAAEHPAGRPIPVEEALEQPVATAIVTSELGVLVGRRNDGKPPWTFIAGEVEPGESPADAAVREVKEETGLRVELAEVIGERVHPKTGRTMIYIAARPTHGTEVFVGDEDELAEVRWVTLPEADELMAAYGMFGPVHEYLAREIGEG